MSTLADDLQAQAVEVRVSKDELAVDLLDGRTLLVPLSWYPRLRHGTPKERKNCRLIGRGSGIHWPDLDEDIRVQDLLVGRHSQESQQSFRRWLEQREGRSKAKR